MNSFQQQAQAPPSEEEYIRRDEDIARTEERRLLASDLAFEYGHDFELREFNGSRRIEPLDETGCTVEEIAAFAQGAHLGYRPRDLYFTRVRT